MAWKETNAIRRIYNVFKRSKDKIYTEDIEALKLINEKIENETKISVNDNLLYAKLLCAYLRLYVLEYGNIKTAIRKANDEMQMPISGQIELLKIALNQKEIHSYLSGLGIKLNNINDQPEIISDNQKNIIEKLKSQWSFENVEKSFYNTANDLLKDVNNYK